MLGRTFLPDEDQHGRNKVVVLDHGYWQRRFGADPKVIGKTLILDKEPWVVIGVMPPSFRPIGTTAAAIYTPYVVADNPHGLLVTGRLKPGVSLEAAQAELNVAAIQLSRENPDWRTLKLSGNAGVGTSNRSTASVAPPTAGGSVFRSTDRLRECRQPSAGAFHGKAA